MVDQAVISVLAILHIISAVGWLGAAIFFVSVIGPTVRTLTPPTSLEFLVRVGTRQLRFFAASATATVIFGLGLLFSYFGTDYTAYPTTLVVGFTLALIVYIETMVFTFPHFRKALKAGAQMLSNPQPGPPPSEFTSNLRKGIMGATISTIVILFVAVLMVVTAFPL